MLIVSVGAAEFRFNASEPGLGFNITYENERLKFTVGLIKDSKLNLIFGKASDAQYDFATFTATGSGSVSDRFGTVSSSSADNLQDFTDFKSKIAKVPVQNSTDMVIYSLTANRKMDTFDTNLKDTILKCGESNEYAYILVGPDGSETTANWVFKTDSSCNVEQTQEFPKPIVVETNSAAILRQAMLVGACSLLLAAL